MHKHAWAGLRKVVRHVIATHAAFTRNDKIRASPSAAETSLRRGVQGLGS